MCVNRLPNSKISDMSKLKAFADNKLDVAEMMISLLDVLEKRVKRRKCWQPAFFSFSQCFPKPSSFGSLTVWTVW